MFSRIEEQLKAVDQTTLTPLVRRALNRDDVEVDGWYYEPVFGGIEMCSGVYRFSGNGQATGETLPWTLILKVAQATPDSQGASHRWRHWKREMLAYQSGLLSDLPGGLVPPRCYGATERRDGTTWIWMEEVRDEVHQRWPLEYYGSVARCLGQFNGAYLTGKPLPDDPWLTRQHLCQYVENAAPAVERLLNSMDHPLIQRALPGISAGFIQEIWEERHDILETIEHLPQTLCHLDAFRRNLFSRRTADRGDQVVAVDWSFLGIAAVGEEIAPLVNGSVAFGAVSPTEELELERIVLEGYLEGLQDAGWRGNPDLVRFGYAATLYWRYAIGGFIGEMVPWMLDEGQHAAVERVMGQSMEEGAEKTATQLVFFQYEYEQVHRLKGVLDGSF
jgi:hypothetical protein